MHTFYVGGTHGRKNENGLCLFVDVFIDLITFESSPDLGWAGSTQEATHQWFGAFRVRPWST